MTDSTGKPISWLEYRSQVTGKSVEQLRQEMRERSAKADKSKGGFASMPKERVAELGSKGGHATREKRRETKPS